MCVIYVLYVFSDKEFVLIHSSLRFRLLFFADEFERLKKK